jgi:hypothetical protein
MCGPAPLASGLKCLTNDGTVSCSYMGKISIVSPGQGKVVC